jgi:nitrate/TMAO reductase-like tetraheme cytochrome c subunit
MKKISNKKLKKKKEECHSCHLVVAHAFNPSTWETEAGKFLGLGPAWSTE